MTEEKIDPFKHEGFVRRLDALKKEQAAGLISGLVLFHEVQLSDARVPWKAPFHYVQDGRPVYEAFKIKADPCFKTIVRLWQVYGPGILLVTEFKHNATWTLKTVAPDITKLNPAPIVDLDTAAEFQGDQERLERLQSGDVRAAREYERRQR